MDPKIKLLRLHYRKENNKMLIYMWLSILRIEEKVEQSVLEWQWQQDNVY